MGQASFLEFNCIENCRQMNRAHLVKANKGSTKLRVGLFKEKKRGKGLEYIESYLPLKDQK
jgi:hypothetical protein